MSDNMLLGLVQRYSQLTEDANSIVRQVTASGDKAAGKMISDIRESSEDERVVQFRAYIADLDAKREAAFSKIEDLIKAELLPADTKVLTPDEQAALKVKYDDLAKRAKSGADFLSSEDSEEITAAMAAAPVLLSWPGKRGGGSAVGSKKPRLAHAEINGEPFSVKVTNKDGVTTEKVSFTAIAQEITKNVKAAGHKDFSVTASDLQKMATETAKTDDLSSVNDVEFVVTTPDENLTVKVFPTQKG